MKESGMNDLNGVIVHGEKEAFDLYNNYAIRTGFSVRKTRKRYDINKNLRQREYCCAKAGQSIDDDKNFSEKQRHTLETRTNCEAMIRFSVTDDTWTVTKFVFDHNHELALPSEVHLLRSNRKLTSSKTNVINAMVDAGISVAETFSYMSKEVEGDEHLGFIKKDMYNYVYQKNKASIEAGDAQSLINHFKQCQAEDGMFSYTVQIDQENRMTNFFWRDGRSRVDYDCFGDVVVFDTTYRTNMYDMICAPFVGINHHWKNVMFGCAFLSNESTTSFIWLFESFLESMGGKQPQTIFTDQDPAMKNAIAVVFPNSRHRLCIWHISKNAPSYLGNLNSNSKFRYSFYKLLQRCETEEEFNQVWGEMCETFEEVKTHKWLNDLYEIRQKWCKGLNKDVFSAGILSSQRSESTNRVLKKISRKTMPLKMFVHQFEGIVASWRSSELEQDFRCKQGTPSLALKNSGLLNHAAKIYTCEMFKHFEKQSLNILGTISTEIAFTDDIRTYEIKGEGESRIWLVHFNTSTMSISCTCKKIEYKGLICSHILRVLSINNVTKIPESLILHRWTKDAKHRLREWGLEKETIMSTPESGSMFRNEMMRYAYDMVTKSQDDEVCRQLCRKGLRDLIISIEKQLSALNFEEPDSNEDNRANLLLGEEKITDTEPPILNPPRAKPKGTSNARYKGHFEIRKGKPKKDMSKCAKGKAKRRKDEANSKSNGDNTSFIGVVPNTNCQFMSSSQMIAPSFAYPLHAQQMSLPFTFSNQILQQNTLPPSFTHMLQTIDSNSSQVWGSSSFANIPPQG